MYEKINVTSQREKAEAKYPWKIWPAHWDNFISSQGFSF
jgi:hypothetical protein